MWPKSSSTWSIRKPSRLMFSVLRVLGTQVASDKVLLMLCGWGEVCPLHLANGPECLGCSYMRTAGYSWQNMSVLGYAFNMQPVRSVEP